MASADIIPSHLVYSKHLLISSKLLIPPLETTGISKLSLIVFIKSQLHSPTKCLFYFLVLPWTVNIIIPKSYNFFTKSKVLFSSSKTLILQLKGIFKFLTAYSTISRTFYSCSNKNEP